MTQPQYVSAPLTPRSDEWCEGRRYRPAGSGQLAQELSSLVADIGTDGTVAPRQSGDARRPSRRDRDRILYSAAFARLAGVTQVITPAPAGRQTHNRLTHSLKVAQLAHSIADLLLEDPTRASAIELHGGVDPDMAEAAALAHDLGHPPFGHIGEKELDRFAQTELELDQGFEGNAQSFRIVTILETHDLGGRGLGLTSGTLAAILKYPWTRGGASDGFPSGGDTLDAPLQALRHDKFGSYGNERATGHTDESQTDFARAMELVPRDSAGRPIQSVEAAVMDVADDITYALHDLDDFYRSGLIRPAPLLALLDAAWRDPNDQGMLSELCVKLKKDYPDRFNEDEMEAAITRTKSALTGLPGEFVGRRDQIVTVQAMVSELISEYLSRIQVGAQGPGRAPLVALASQDWHMVEILKRVTRHFVINRPSLASVQKGQEHLLRHLLLALQSWLVKGPMDRPPAAFLDSVQASVAVGTRPDVARKRALIDYVASLTDLQAIELDRVLTGGYVDLSGGFL